MSFNDGFSIKPIPFVEPLAGTASMLVSSPDGTSWIPSGIVDNAVSASVYVIETIVTQGNIDGNGAPEDPVVLKNNISLASVTASFNGDGNQVTNITASNIPNFTPDVRLQLTGSQYVDYNALSGVISLPYTGTILGTTPLILGQTNTTVTGLASISSSLGYFNELSASSSEINNLKIIDLRATNLYVNNLFEGTSSVQPLTAATQIIPSTSLVKVSSSSGLDITLTASPTIKITGYTEGMKINVVNVGAGKITFTKDTGNTTRLKLVGGKSFSALEFECIQFVLVSGSSGFYWVEAGRGA